jgi:CRP-like cAMP-binding protein
MATATALTDTTLIVILSFSVFEIAEQKPNLLRTIQNIIEDRNLKNKVTEDSLRKVIS